MYRVVKGYAKSDPGDAAKPHVVEMGRSLARRTTRRRPPATAPAPEPSAERDDEPKECPEGPQEILPGNMTPRLPGLPIGSHDPILRLRGNGSCHEALHPLGIGDYVLADCVAVKSRWHEGDEEIIQGPSSGFRL